MRDEIVEVESAEAGSAVNIITQPQSVKAEVGDTVTFTVEAENVASYVWEYSANGGMTWRTSSNKTNTISYTLTEGNKVYIRRCKLTGKDGNVVYTNEVGILDNTMTITKQPESVKAEVGDTVTFTVEAENVASYVWEYSANGGTTWRTSSNRTNTISYTLTASTKDYIRRCKLTGEDGTILYTDEVGILDNTLKITKQPESVKAEVGDTVTFTVEAENVASYVWEYSANGGTTWRTSTNKTNTISYTLTSGNMIYIRRCKLTGEDGTILYTDEVGILDDSIKIIKQPESVKATVGETVTFTVEAENVAAYHWQYSTNGGENWKYSSNKTDTISFTLTEAAKGYLRRCELTGVDGTVIYTDEVGIIISEIVVGDVTYRIIEDTNTVVVAAYAGSSSSLTIPQEVEGYTVTQIGESAFEGNTTLQSIDLPDTIVIIGKRAFAGCSSLSEMK